MTYTEAIDYIHSVCWLGSRPGLERITELCSLMGNIQDKLEFIHVAGTNGKGSVCSMLTQILVNEGLRVGSFTSPYVFRFNERMAINAEPIKDSELAEIIEEIKPLAESMKDSPTEFELITAAGFLYFYKKKCDIVILECGMGGRLDSTNIIKTPKLSIITGIALDHTAYLGDTEEKIALEKAGIIKTGVPVVCGSMKESCMNVITNRAGQLGSTVITCRHQRVSNIKLSPSGASFDFEGFDKRFDLKLAGGYQPHNAAIAITAAEALGISQRSIHTGICRAQWRARFEFISRDPDLIYDGGHNPQGVEEAVKTVKALYNERINIISGVMADKDYRLMASLIAPIAKRVYCVKPQNMRALDAQSYAAAFTELGIQAYPCTDLKEAIERSRADNAPTLALGSLYMYEEFMKAWQEVTECTE